VITQTKAVGAPEEINNGCKDQPVLANAKPYSPSPGYSTLVWMVFDRWKACTPVTLIGIRPSHVISLATVSSEEMTISRQGGLRPQFWKENIVVTEHLAKGPNEQLLGEIEMVGAAVAVFWPSVPPFGLQRRFPQPLID